MSGEEKTTEQASASQITTESESSGTQGSRLAEQEGSLIRSGQNVEDEAEQQFRRTCEKINEIEERARHALTSPDPEHRCSFCNRLSSEAGPLCQPDHVDVCICLQCAETALSLLRKQGD